MVEIFFGIITRQAIRRGTSRNVKDLVGNSSPSDVVTLRSKMTPLREPHVVGR